MLSFECWGSKDGSVDGFIERDLSWGGRGADGWL